MADELKPEKSDRDAAFTALPLYDTEVLRCIRDEPPTVQAFARHRQQAYDQGRADERAAEMGRQCGARADLNFLRLSVEDGDPKAEVLLRIEDILHRWFK